MIHILHIHTMPIISGSGINTFISMNGMDKVRYRVALACAPGGPLLDLVRNHDMGVITFTRMTQPVHLVKDLWTLIELTNYLKKHHYDIIHTHNSKAGFLGRLAGKRAGIPVIIHTVHGFAFHDQEPFWRRTLFRVLERAASRWCDKMIFISQPLIDWALKERIVGAEKIVRIYSGIDLGQFKPVSEEAKADIRKKWRLNSDDVVIGMVSKLWDGKGHGVLIKAFKDIKKNISNAKLIIVGEGYRQDSLKTMVHGYGLDDSVIFTGFLMDVSEIMAVFDVSVLPSFFEGMGRVLLESMAMGKPVVASRVGGIPELVEDYVNGLLTPPGDVIGLSKAIQEVLKNKDLAVQMGEEGRKKVTERFSAPMMVKDIEKVYLECLKNKGIQYDL
ncbi:MAG: glycosyltransferase family 4 protein [Deltaproteobacteria bacterium]|nr:glycosyltransferase family 4 protein [Deltaproteobacteria bacterium]